MKNLMQGGYQTFCHQAVPISHHHHHSYYPIVLPAAAAAAALFHSQIIASPVTLKKKKSSNISQVFTSNKVVTFMYTQAIP